LSLGKVIGNPAPVVQGGTAYSAIKVTQAFKDNLAANLATGGDVYIRGDSIFSGQNDSWDNSVQLRLKNVLHSWATNGVEPGYGFYSVPDVALGTTDIQQYFHEKTFTGSKTATGENYSVLRVARSSGGANSACRFSFPATIKGRKIKRVELVMRGSSPATATWDAYSVATPLASGDAVITAGTATGISHSGLTGQTGTINFGTWSNSMEVQLGVLPIVFDGVTHNPVIQVTTSSADVYVTGIILYCDDADVNGRGIRVHCMSASGNALFPGRSADLVPYKSNWGMRIEPFGFGNYGLGSSQSPISSPSINGKLIITDFMINDRGSYTTTLEGWRGYCPATVDQWFTQNPRVQVLWIIPYCVGNPPEWRDGIDDAEGSWQQYANVIYSIQAKYPSRVAIINVDALLGYETYANAITARGWNTPDIVHWQGGGPQFLAAQFAGILPTPVSAPRATGLDPSLGASCVVGLRLESETIHTSRGSFSGTFSRNTSGADPAQFARRTPFTLVGNTFSGGNNYGMISSGAVTTPTTGDFTIFARVKVTVDALAGMAYISSVFGEEGGAGGTFQIRLGTGVIGTLRKISVTGASAESTNAIALNTWATIAYTRVGSVGTYYINGVSDRVVTASSPTATAQVLRIGEVNGSFRPITGEISHVGLWNRALSAAELLALTSNPDALFTLA
jgi:hypothetical protein